MKRLLAALGAVALVAATPSYGQVFPAKNLAPSSVSCASTSTLAAPFRNRNGITLTVPSGGVTVFIGNSGVTTATGFPIAAGAALTLEPFSGAVYCVVATGTQTLNMVETLP